MTQKKKRSSKNSNKKGSGGASRRSWWDHPAVKWAGGIITAALVAVLSGVGSEAAQKLKSYVSSHKDRSQANDSGTPAMVDEVKGIADITGGSWISPKLIDPSPSQLIWLQHAYQSDRDSYVNWFKSQGAVARGGNMIELDLVGNRSSPVRIMNIQPVSQCHAAPSSATTLFYLAGQGQDSTIKMSFDLGQVGQAFETWSEGDEQKSGNYFADHKYTLSREEHVTFRISVGTQKFYACTYHFKIDVIANGKLTTWSIDDHGKPFEFVNMNLGSSTYRRLYVGTPYCGQSSGGQWKQVNPKFFKEVETNPAVRC